MRELRDVLIEYYLDYVNNYLTFEKFAEHNGLRENEAMQLIAIGKTLYNTSHPES
jgi:hypothetical protein